MDFLQNRSTMIWYLVACAIMEGLTERALWIGGAATTEHALARDWARDTLAAHGSLLDDHADPAAAIAGRGADSSTPRLALLATATPADWSVADAVELSQAWPLMPIVSVATSLVEGRRRSGPALPGIEEVAWFDLPGRLESWLAHWEAGCVGTLAMPTTVRRDERWLALAESTIWHVPAGLSAAVVAATPDDTAALAAFVAAAGGTVAATAIDRPPLDEAAAILIWEVPRLTPDHLAWLRLLSANRPALRTLVIESFPRGDSVQAAMEAGAAAVLGRPLSLESLAGRLRRLGPAPDGLGEACRDR